ncbi:DUF3800 domain-containing protein [Prevotella cerevisiae]|uniref:DUF3800 domain-containing protein n=1 Tax=Segatella cerevisiae TaxID=2053716 RepID=A0ABT1BZL2_9BACT|nr:DUF3800 domain-containing protein [Segatella cerevisiae]MCO6026535.1 DUF3800 domain-containing protein [Segatella cerevisiae]
MARKILAYIDECGAYGFDFTKSGNSPCFIVCAILINEGDKEFVDSQLTNIRNKYFSGTEIKSNHIKGNHKRRIKILSEVIKLPFTIVALVVDKTTVFADYGITKNKKTFYKFINQLLYNELRGPFANLTITSDEVGENDFCREFLKYVQVHRKQISLFDQEIFSLKNSKEVNGVQLADLIAGTLSYIYDANKKKSVPQNIDYFKILTKNISNIAFFPQSYDENMFEHKEGDSHYSQEIAMLTYRKAKSFIDDHQKSTDEDISRQVFVLRYLMFRFKYNYLRKYIPTKELIKSLRNMGYEMKSEQMFRSRVIAKLRDNGVIISSSPKGYKLPSSESEITDYYQHVNGVVLPMIHRLDICNKYLKEETTNKIDYIDKLEFRTLKNILEAYESSDHVPFTN